MLSKLVQKSSYYLQNHLTIWTGSPSKGELTNNISDDWIPFRRQKYIHRARVAHARSHSRSLIAKGATSAACSSKYGVILSYWLVIVGVIVIYFSL